MIPIRDAQSDARLLERWAKLERDALEPNPFFAPQMVLPAARHLEDGQAVQLLMAEQGGELRFLMPVSGGTARWPVPAAGCGRGCTTTASSAPRCWRPTATQIGSGRRSSATSGAAPRRPCWSCPCTRPRVPWRRHSTDRPGPGSGSAAARRRSAGSCFAAPSPATPASGFPETPGQHGPASPPAGPYGGDAQVETVDRAAAGLDGAIEQFLTLEAKGWKGRSRTALACRPGDARFFREMSRGFADQGRLMFLSLEAGTRVLAQNTALVGGGGLFGFKRAYDEDFARWSPGSLLDLDVLDWFHQQAPLAWLDTCSAPDDVTGATTFGDRRAICTLAIPLSPLGTAAAALSRPPSGSAAVSGPPRRASWCAGAGAPGRGLGACGSPASAAARPGCTWPS